MENLNTIDFSNCVSGKETSYLRLQGLHRGDGIFKYRVNLSGRLIFANPSLIDKLGYSENSLIGMDGFAIIAPEYRAFARSRFSQVLRSGGKHNYLELPVIRTDGSLIWLGQKIKLRYSGKRVVGFDVEGIEVKDPVSEYYIQTAESLQYASYIQESIHPSGEAMKRAFKDHFVSFIPKDKVSGDFYFLEEKDNLIYFALGDCTGHGVPAAMISILAVSTLRKVVSEDITGDPSMILEVLDQEIKRSLWSGERSLNDGFEIALCVYEKSTSRLRYSGAHLDMFYSKDGSIYRFHGNKRSIGDKHFSDRSFLFHELKVSSKDVFYFFTDGYTDQFGGPLRKKYKKKNLLELLRIISRFNLQEQQRILLLQHKTWKGFSEQVDDILFAGIKFL